MQDTLVAALQEIGRNRGRARALVLGDLMLDRYLWGDVERISPEAPVPVMRIERDGVAPGGAGNVAMNLVGLGVRTEVLGYVGDDPAGESLVGELRDAGIDVRGIRRTARHATTTKTRVVARAQQVIRLDREYDLPVAEDDEAALLLGLERSLEADVDLLVVSDYGKGVVNARTSRAAVELAKARGIPQLVDPSGTDADRYRGATALCPNRSELEAILGTPVRGFEEMAAAGRALRTRLELSFLVVTLGEDGILCIDGDGARRSPTEAREVYDVTGAGDTVIATLCAGLAAGVPHWDSLALANVATGVTVGKIGTAPIAFEELRRAVEAGEPAAANRGVSDLATAKDLVARWRRAGQRIVFTNGCFDLLHAGHLECLERARATGDRLVVGLNSDRSVCAIKGRSRPVQPEADRARILSGLACVDAVVLFDDGTPLELIEQLEPDVLAKGADYDAESIVGAAETRARGGRVVRIPLVEGRSTSALLRRARGDDDGE